MKGKSREGKSSVEDRAQRRGVERWTAGDKKVIQCIKNRRKNSSKRD